MNIGRQKGVGPAHHKWENINVFLFSDGVYVQILGQGFMKFGA